MAQSRRKRETKRQYLHTPSPCVRCVADELISQTQGDLDCNTGLHFHLFLIGTGEFSLFFHYYERL